MIDQHKAARKDHSKIKPNIYENGITMSQHIKRFDIIHGLFKYKFLVPLIKIGNFLLGKSIFRGEDIPKESHNRNILILNSAYEEAIKKWYLYYLRNTGDPRKRKSRKYLKAEYKKEKPLRSMKNYIITMYMYDTAYREFVNILMHEIANGMSKEYTKPEYKNGKTGHLLYTVDPYEQAYFVFEKALRYNVYLSTQEAEKLLDDYYKYHKKRVKHDKKITDHKNVLEQSQQSPSITHGNIREDSTTNDIAKNV